MKKRRIIYIGAVVLFVLAMYCAYAGDLPKWFTFNQKNALQEWQEKIFKNRVMYAVKTEKNKDGYLSATSQQACSGLIYKLKFDIYDFPLLSWQWKVMQFPRKVQTSGKPTEGWLEGDDYAARVYVIFSSWNFMNMKSLEYVWDENLPPGQVITSPYFRNIKLIVAESGKKNLNNWVAVERNIFADYQKAFGAKPPRYVSAIAIMTDADNTLSTAEAAYQNLKVGYKK